MVAAPPDTPVTVAVVAAPLVTVATVVVALLHVPLPGLPVHVVVAPCSIGLVPPVTAGSAFTVTVVVAMQPLVLV